LRAFPDRLTSPGVAARLHSMKGEKSVEDLEKERMELFERYLHLEEVLEDYNQQKYDVCCGIERLNKELKAAIEERARKEAKEAKASPPSA